MLTANFSNLNKVDLSPSLGSKDLREGRAELRHHGLLLGQWLLEQPGLERYRGEITEALHLLRSGSAETLSEALGSICHGIKTALPKGMATLIFRASCESSPTLFTQSVVELAQSYRQEGNFELLPSLYTLALEAVPEEHQELRTTLQKELSALQGQGSFSDGLALGLRRLPHEMMNSTVLAMGVGSLSNTLGTKLLGNVLKGSLGKGSAVFLARAGGMATDAIFFTSTQYGIDLAQGKPTHNFTQSLLHAGLMLTSLRVSGSLARTGLQTQAIQNTLKNFSTIPRKVVEAGLPLFAEFQGILGANQLGATLGLGEVSAHAGLDTLFTMTHFRMAQSWLKLSPHYTQLHHQLTRETETMLRDLASNTYQSFTRLVSKWAGPGAWGGQRLAYANGISEVRNSQQEKMVPSASYLRGEVTSGPGRGGPILRRYQEDLLHALVEKMQTQEDPWLSIVAPPQTGKSYLTGPFIEATREIPHYRKARFLVVAYSRTAQRQVYEDLTEQFGFKKVGRFGNKLQENVNAPILVVGSQSLIKNFAKFGQPGELGWNINKRPTVIIHDEAFLSLSEGMKKVHEHFGFEMKLDEAGKLKTQPHPFGSRVIGLAGTPDRITNYYRNVDTYDILSAWEDGYLRHVDSYSLPFSAKELSFESREEVGAPAIWWKLTRSNAQALVKAFIEQVYNKEAKKSLIYAPTTDHADLLLEMLQEVEALSGERVFCIHSKRPATEDRDQALEDFNQKGGIMIAVDMFNRSYRGNEGLPIDAIFLTYQTSSLELFSQRVGRGWAQDVAYPLPPLRVIEVSWSHRAAKQAMANMMRLLGFTVDHPGHFETRGQIGKLRTLRETKAAQAQLEEAVRVGKLRPLFRQAPISLDWRREVLEALSDPEMTTQEYADQAGLHPWQIEAYRYGAIPVRWREARPLSPWLGGEDNTRELWVKGWHEILDNIHLWDHEADVSQHQEAFASWQQLYREQGASVEVARSLEYHLIKRFPKSVLWEKNVGSLKGAVTQGISASRAFSKFRINMGGEISDRRLREAFIEMFTLATQRRALGLYVGDFGEIYYHWRRVKDASRTLSSLANEWNPTIARGFAQRLGQKGLTILNDIFNYDPYDIFIDDQVFMKLNYGWTTRYFPFPEFSWKVRYLLHLHKIRDDESLAGLDQIRLEALGLFPEEAQKVLRIQQYKKDEVPPEMDERLAGMREELASIRAASLTVFPSRAEAWLLKRTSGHQANRLYTEAIRILDYPEGQHIEEKKLALKILQTWFPQLPKSVVNADENWLNLTLRAYRDPELREAVIKTYQKAVLNQERLNPTDTPLDEPTIIKGLALLAECYGRSRGSPLQDRNIFSDPSLDLNSLRAARDLLKALFPLYTNATAILNDALDRRLAR